MGFLLRPLRGVQPLSYTGWSSSNYLTRTDSALTNEPVTLFAWIRHPSAAAVRVAVGLDRGLTTNPGHFLLWASAADAVQASKGINGGADAQATVGTTFVDRFIPAAALFEGNSSRYAWANGIKSSQNTSALSSQDPSITTQTVGRYLRTNAPGPAPFTDGHIALATIWNAVLTDPELAVLAAGVFPGLVRPDAIVRAWWMLPGYPPGHDFSGQGAHLTLTGTIRPGATPPVGH